MANGTEITPAKQAADAITSAVDATSKDASSNMLAEVNDALRGAMSQPQVRREVGDELLIMGDIWRDVQGSAIDIDFRDGGRTLENLANIAAGKAPDGMDHEGATESLGAQALLDVRNTGVWGNEYLPWSPNEQFDRFNRANTLMEVAALGEDRFKKFAGDDKLDINEVNNALSAGNLTDQERRTLQDLSQDMELVKDNWITDGSAAHVTWSTTADRLKDGGEYGKEAKVITTLTNAALARRTADSVVVTPPGPIDTTTTDTGVVTTDTGVTTDTATTDTSTTTDNGSAFSDLPGTSNAFTTETAQRGDGYDRIAQRVLAANGMEGATQTQIYYMSMAIAAINNNDRNYSNGRINVGDPVTVPVFASQQEVLDFIAQTKAAS